MKYYAMLFEGDASGVTTSNGLLDCCQEDHGSLTVAQISKKDFDGFGDRGIPKKKLTKIFSVTLVESVKIQKVK